MEIDYEPNAWADLQNDQISRIKSNPPPRLSEFDHFDDPQTDVYEDFKSDFDMITQSLQMTNVSQHRYNSGTIEKVVLRKRNTQIVNCANDNIKYFNNDIGVKRKIHQNENTIETPNATEETANKGLNVNCPEFIPSAKIDFPPLPPVMTNAIIKNKKKRNNVAMASIANIVEENLKYNLTMDDAMNKETNLKLNKTPGNQMQDAQILIKEQNLEKEAPFNKLNVFETVQPPPLMASIINEIQTNNPRELVEDMQANQKFSAWLSHGMKSADYSLASITDIVKENLKYNLKMDNAMNKAKETNVKLNKTPGNQMQDAQMLINEQNLKKEAPLNKLNVFETVQPPPLMASIIDDIQTNNPRELVEDMQANQKVSAWLRHGMKSAEYSAASVTNIVEENLKYNLTMDDAMNKETNLKLNKTPGNQMQDAQMLIKEQNLEKEAPFNKLNVFETVQPPPLMASIINEIQINNPSELVEDMQANQKVSAWLSHGMKSTEYLPVSSRTNLNEKKMLLLDSNAFGFLKKDGLVSSELKSSPKMLDEFKLHAPKPKPVKDYTPSKRFTKIYETLKKRRDF